VTDATSRGRAGELRAMTAYVEQAPLHGHVAEVVDVSAFDRLQGFDAVFLRLDTNVLGLSLAASRYAWALGKRVVDDPRSIITCMNKAHVHGLLENAGIPTPDTVLLTRAGYDALDAPALFSELGSPIVCKAPSGAFSSAVERAADPAALEEIVGRFAARSDVVLLQRYMPSTFDWRVGILCGRAIYAARYHIPKGAWRIHDRPEGEQRKQWARVERIPLTQVPRDVMRIAITSAESIGRGLYGVDLKETDDGRTVVIEVNDNPNVDWDSELPAGSPMFGKMLDLVATEGPRA
jgi:glutathione synthase/RimK-type ligase-like ATP-grasp enzyme